MEVCDSKISFIMAILINLSIIDKGRNLLAPWRQVWFVRLIQSIGPFVTQSLKAMKAGDKVSWLVWNSVWWKEGAYGINPSTKKPIEIAAKVVRNSNGAELTAE